VINGVIAVPMMVVMMIVVSRPTEMGRFRARPMLRAFGWGATAVMAAASVAMLAAMALGGGAG
jgi:Mn2+/Fe2+ NRAMP family transporter